jgi:hypothetical protein
LMTTLISKIALPFSKNSINSCVLCIGLIWM